MGGDSLGLGWAVPVKDHGCVSWFFVVEEIVLCRPA